MALSELVYTLNIRLARIGGLDVRPIELRRLELTVFARKLPEVGLFEVGLFEVGNKLRDDRLCGAGSVSLGARVRMS